MCEKSFRIETTKKYQKFTQQKIKFRNLRKKMFRFLLFLLIFERGKCNLDDQPRISTDNGDLTFSTSNTKNIFFKTSSGKIFLNNEDISETISNLNIKVNDHQTSLVGCPHYF